MNSEWSFSQNDYGDFTYEGKVYHLTDMAEPTSRLMDSYPYHEAGDGDEYKFEMSAPAVDAYDNKFTVYWIFWAVKGEEKELDEYDYYEIDRIEQN